jgi:predicted HTH transcriptional regulator
MTLEELKKLVQQGEHQSLEFKKKIAYPEKVVRELIAFANSAGGVLVVGVDDDGSFSGQRFIEEEAFTLDRAIQTYIRPQLQYSRELIPLNAKKGFAVYTIPPGRKKPYFFVDAEEQKRCYVRIKDRSIQASREIREIIRRQDRHKGARFEYGEKEQALMHHLREHPHITLTELRKIARIPKFVASNTLIRLVLAGVLRVVPGEKEDKFYAVT